MATDRVGRAVDAAIAAAVFDPDAEPVDGLDARVRFVDQRAVSALAELFKDHRHRQQVIETLDTRMKDALRAGPTSLLDPLWKTAYVAMRLRDRLEGVTDRRYSEGADGLLRMLSERDLKPVDPYADEPE